MDSLEEAIFNIASEAQSSSFIEEDIALPIKDPLIQLMQQKDKKSTVKKKPVPSDFYPKVEEPPKDTFNLLFSKKVKNNATNTRGLLGRYPHQPY